MLVDVGIPVTVVLEGIISLIIALYSIKGYVKFQSNVLKQFSLAFIFLFLGFFIDAMAFLFQGGLTVWVSYVSTGLQTLGYIFLAWSHISSVRKEIREGALPAFFVIPIILMKSLGLYFLLYAAVETTISSFKKEQRIAMLSSTALYLIFLGEFLDLIGLYYIPEVLPGMLRFIGFVVLLLPLALTIGQKGVVKKRK